MWDWRNFEKRAGSDPLKWHAQVGIFCKEKLHWLLQFGPPGVLLFIANSPTFSCLCASHTSENSLSKVISFAAPGITCCDAISNFVIASWNMQKRFSQLAVKADLLSLVVFFGRHELSTASTEIWSRTPAPNSIWDGYIMMQEWISRWIEYRWTLRVINLWVVKISQKSQNCDV